MTVFVLRIFNLCVELSFVNKVKKKQHAGNG